MPKYSEGAAVAPMHPERHSKAASELSRNWFFDFRRRRTLLLGQVFLRGQIATVILPEPLEEIGIRPMKIFESNADLSILFPFCIGCILDDQLMFAKTFLDAATNDRGIEYRGFPFRSGNFLIVQSNGVSGRT